MVQCEICKAWQHGQCMHYAAADLVPNHYFCEDCRPDLWGEVIKCVLPGPLPSSIPSHHETQGLGRQACPTILISLSPSFNPASSKRPPKFPLSLTRRTQDHEASEYDEQSRCRL